MTDRELLELAAKAAGMNVLPDGPWPDDAKGWFYNPHGQGGMFSSETPLRWNPLTDDGDALRLAVKLAIDVRLFCSQGWRPEGRHHVVETLVDRLGRGCREEVASDPYAATRRAIVRAAAAIGKDMP